MGDKPGMTSGPLDAQRNHSATPSTGAPMTGMMTAENMAKLQAGKDAGCDTRWLQMMTQHHQGAIATDQK
jgi:uncharacterized protein (DUF305 family)